MAIRLEDIRLQKADMKDNHSDFARADAAYAAAFQTYGIDLANLDAEGAAERIQASAIRQFLVDALDDWVWVKEKPAERERLLAIARLADIDGRRNGFRELLGRKPKRTELGGIVVLLGPGREVLEEVASQVEFATLSPSTALLLARPLDRAGAQDKALEVLYAAQRANPADFWLNWELSQLLLWRSKPPRAEEAAGFLRAALVVRPEHPVLHVSLATAHNGLEQFDRWQGHRMQTGLRRGLPRSGRRLRGKRGVE
jgi:predicted Zn-dependent protease